MVGWPGGIVDRLKSTKVDVFRAGVTMITGWLHATLSIHSTSTHPSHHQMHGTHGCLSYITLLVTCPAAGVRGIVVVIIAAACRSPLGLLLSVLCLAREPFTGVMDDGWMDGRMDNAPLASGQATLFTLPPVAVLTGGNQVRLLLSSPSRLLVRCDNSGGLLVTAYHCRAATRWKQVTEKRSTKHE